MTDSRCLQPRLWWHTMSQNSEVEVLIISLQFQGSATPILSIAFTEHLIHIVLYNHYITDSRRLHNIMMGYFVLVIWGGGAGNIHLILRFTRTCIVGYLWIILYSLLHILTTLLTWDDSNHRDRIHCLGNPSWVTDIYHTQFQDLTTPVMLVHLPNHLTHITVYDLYITQLQTITTTVTGVHSLR